jgi:hypothetical protein
MAKITARGDKAVATYKRADADGYTIVLTANGRLLRKMGKHLGYNVIGRNVTGDQADAYAALMGCHRV